MTSESRALSVIKIGGALLSRSEDLDVFWKSVLQLRERMAVVVVHGGGPQATAMARTLGHEPRIIHGRRVTSDLDLDIMKWTLRGALNVELVAQAIRHHIPAVGLCGVDGATVVVQKRPPWEIDGEMVDFGWVGDVIDINTNTVDTLIQAGFVPVLSPLAVDNDGFIYNVNADTVAYSLAGALKAAEFLLVTESGGVQREIGQPETLLSTCNEALYQSGITEGWIQGGMRVKLQVAFEAIHTGVPDVFILSPDDLTSRSRGTRVTL